MTQLFSRILGKQVYKEVKLTALVLLFLIPFSVIIYKLYTPHINSFGCFDECMNYIGGYFILKGRDLYSQIFFNHQPFMAYLSFLVLKIFHPVNLFTMLLRYKQIVLAIGIVGNFFIIRRFRWVGIGFAIIFELTKYYLFADKFLAESVIVYPVVYVTGLIWYRMLQKKIYIIEYFIAAILMWIVIFAREPYALLGIGLLVSLIGWPNSSIKKLGYIFFIALSIGTVLLLPIHEYIYQVFFLNATGVGSADAQNTNLFGWGIFQVFFYPIFIFFDGIWNEFRIILVGTSIVFCWCVITSLLRKENRKGLVLFFILLGLANIRFVPPGEVFYAAFHMIVWFGMFLILTLLMIEKTRKRDKKIGNVLSGIMGITFITYVFLSKSFLQMRVNSQTEFAINFGETYQIGQVVHIVSKPGQTFFIDHEDNVDASYILSERISPYPYSDYGFIAPNIFLFQNAYSEMFQKTPPDFYYGVLSKKYKNEYVQLTQFGKPSKLYVKKSVYDQIHPEIWEKIQQLGYEKQL